MSGRVQHNEWRDAFRKESSNEIIPKTPPKEVLKCSKGGTQKQKLLSFQFYFSCYSSVFLSARILCVTENLDRNKVVKDKAKKRGLMGRNNVLQDSSILASFVLQLELPFVSFNYLSLQLKRIVPGLNCLILCYTHAVHTPHCLLFVIRFR